jgi:hypothetical protein
MPGSPYLLWREQENWSECGSDSAVQEEPRTTKFYRKVGIFTRRLLRLGETIALLYSGVYGSLAPPKFRA